MTYKEIYDALCETDLPVALNFWEKDIPDLPYIVYTIPSNNDFIADNVNYSEIARIDVGLYTKRKSLTTEKTVETVLTKHFGAFFKSSEWVQSDHLQETIYTLEVAINGE